MKELTDNQKIKWINECWHSGNIETWTIVRKYIIKAIHKNGTFLDLSACNGFALYSFMKWSNYKLIPYGSDIHPMIKKAKILFPEYKKNFIQRNMVDLIYDVYKPKDWPKKFDFIYVNQHPISKINSKIFCLAYIDKIFEKVKKNGRIIITFCFEKKYNAEKRKKEIDNIIKYLKKYYKKNKKGLLISNQNSNWKTFYIQK